MLKGLHNSVEGLHQTRSWNLTTSTWGAQGAYSAAVSKFFNRIRRTSAAHQYLQKVRIGENEEDIGLNGTCNKPAVFDARFYIPRSFVVMKANGVAAGHLLLVIAGIGPLYGIHFNIVFSPPPLASPVTCMTSWWKSKTSRQVEPLTKNQTHLKMHGRHKTVSCGYFKMDTP